MTQLATQDPRALAQQFRDDLERERAQRDVGAVAETQNLSDVAQQFRQSITAERAAAEPPQLPPAVSGVVPPVREFVHPDGRRSSELTISVEDERLNGGEITIIPTIWEGVKLDPGPATDRAVASGLRFPHGFSSHKDADRWAEERSEKGGASTQGFLGFPSPTTSTPGLPVGRFQTSLEQAPSQFQDAISRAERHRFAQRFPPNLKGKKKAAVSAVDVLSNLGKAFAGGVATGVADIPKGVAFAALELEDLGRRALDAGRVDDDLEDYMLFQFGQAIEDFVAEHLPSDPRLRDSFIFEKVPRALGQAATFLVGGGAAKALKAGRIIQGGVVATQGAAGEAASQFEQARAKGATQAESRLAGKYGALIGTTEVLGVPFSAFRLARRLDRASGGVLNREIKRRIRIGVVGSAQEAAEEFFQTTAGNLVAQKIYDKERKLLEGSVEAGGVGGTVGAIINTIAGTAGVLRRQREPATAQARAQPTEQAPPSQVAVQAARMAQENPQAAQRLIEAADKAVQARGPGGVPSKTDFAAEGLAGLNRAQRREFIDTLRAEPAPAPKAAEPQTFEVVRRIAKGDPATLRASEKTQGLFTSIVEPGGEGRTDLPADVAIVRGTARPKNPLKVPLLQLNAKTHSEIVRPGFTFLEVDANVSALRELVGESEFNKLVSESQTELIARVEGKVGREQFTDKLDVLTALGAQEARKAGFDAIVQIDTQHPEFSEFVALEDGIIDFKKPTPKAVPRETLKPRITPQTESPAKLSKKTKRAIKDAGDALDELGKHLSSTTFANPLADPKTITLVAKAVGKSVKAGIYTFADFVRWMGQKMGDERVGRLGPLLVQEWNSQRAKNPRMDSAGDVGAILKLGDRVEPRGRAPGLTELPKVNEANTAKPLDLLDQWFADRDEAITEAEIQTGQHQERVKKLVRRSTYGKAAQELDQAIALYIDLKGKPEQFGKWGDKLSDEQRRLYERSQNLSAAELKLAERIRLENRLHGRRAKEAGVIASYLENYTARLWESPKELRKTLLRRFQVTTGRAKRRTLESILHGWALGKTLRVTGATNAQLLARSEIAKVIHDRNLIQLGARAGLLDDTQHTGWRKIEHPNFRKWVWVGKVEEGKVYGRDVYLSPEGDVFRRAELYAEPLLAKRLNNALGRSVLADIRPIEWVTKWNAITKHMILTVSLFHHQAFARSSILGSRSVRGIKSYQMGKQAIANYTQELRDLVRAGLTIGRVQDWEEDYLHQRTAIGRVLDKVPMARDVRDKLVEQRDRQTNFLFRKLGAYLKVQNAILEYRHLLKKHAKDIESGKRTRHHYAKISANVSNDDFGGLHLGRMGRDPTIQHIFRLFALAPDWTESNVRSMVKAFKRGDEARVYQALWARVLIRGLGATALLNLALAGFDDEEFLKRYKRAWEEGHLRWLDVDVTPLYRRLGGTNEKRKWFSLIGHFRDPLKFIVHPIRSAKHKSSVLGAFISDAATGTDWADRPFTTFAELVGLDDKGEYKTTVKGRHVKGDPKGGKLKGALVRPRRGGGGPLEYGQVPSYLLARARSTTPIPIQNGIAYMAGEIDGFDAITKSMGLMTSTTYPPSSPEASIKKAFELEDQEMAIAALDRLVSEAKAEATGTAIVKPRLRYVGRLVYGATNKNEPNELSRDLLPFLKISHQEARMAFKSYWRSRGYSTGSDAYRDRRRELARLYLRRGRR